MAEKTHYIGGWAPGQGCYALAEVVGQGGFATVWRARPVNGSQKGLLGVLGRGNQEVAVKVIPIYSAKERSRALREGQIARGLRHPNIVETLEVIPGDLEVYLVTEFVHGVPLDVAAARALLANQPEELPPRLLNFVNRATSPNPTHRPRNANTALKLLTGPRGGTGTTATETFKKEKIVDAGRFAGQAPRVMNGLVAGWLGYLGAGLLFGGAEALGVAPGFALLGYLLPRLGALGVIVALAVALARSQQAGLGLTTLLPAVGGLWIAAGSIGQSARQLPLGPLLAIPLAAGGLGAGLPILLGALMRPLGAAL